MSRLIALPLSPADAHTVYEHLPATGAEAVAAAPAAVLPRDGDCTLLLPPAALSWHRVRLPAGVGRRTPRLRAVLEGLLEDRLLDEPAGLHLALAPGLTADGHHWVAACDRTWLHGHLQQLEGAGLRVSRLVPMAVPDGESPRLHLLGDATGSWLLASGGTTSGGVLMLPATAESLALLRPTDGPDAEASADPELTALAERLLQRPVRPLPRAAWLQGAAGSDWDLAQFELARRGPARWAGRLAPRWQSWRTDARWRAARWGLLALVVGQLLGVNAWAWKERADWQARRDAIRATLTDTFPAVTLVVDAPVQMAREVMALRQATGAAAAGDFEPLLGALAQALPAGRAATGLDYDGRELRVLGLALGGDELAALQARLQSLGYQARVDGERLVLQAGAAP